MSRLQTGEINGLVKQVSRSFYLTLRMLPASIRPQISLAYLLARATDTIADTRLIEAGRREASLTEMRSAIADAAAGKRFGPTAFGSGPLSNASALGFLLSASDRIIETLRMFEGGDRLLIREVLDTIISGQRMDLERFGSASADRMVCLESDAELDDYTYRVAGCVGEFWTRMCRAHVFPEARLDDASLLAGGVRFGKGLQLTNILRDIPRDLQRGRCYLPCCRLEAHGLRPGDLLEQSAMSRFRPLYNEYLGLAREHLSAGWKYVLALPRGQARLRLACAWPILIGLKTLRLLNSNNVLDAETRIKISRTEIRRLIASSVLRYPWARAWERQFELDAEDETF